MILDMSHCNSFIGIHSFSEFDSHPRIQFDDELTAEVPDDGAFADGLKKVPCRRVTGGRAFGEFGFGGT